MNKNGSNSPGDRTRTSNKNQFENNQALDLQTVGYSFANGQSKRIKPMENQNDIVEKLIKFLKSE